MNSAGVVFIDCGSIAAEIHEGVVINNKTAESVDISIDADKCSRGCRINRVYKLVVAEGCLIAGCSLRLQLEESTCLNVSELRVFNDKVNRRYLTFVLNPAEH